VGSIIHKVIDGVGGKSFVEQEIEPGKVFFFFSFLVFFFFLFFGLKYFGLN